MRWDGRNRGRLSRADTETASPPMKMWHLLFIWRHLLHLKRLVTKATTSCEIRNFQIRQWKTTFFFYGSLFRWIQLFFSPSLFLLFSKKIDVLCKSILPWCSLVQKELGNSGNCLLELVYWRKKREWKFQKKQSFWDIIPSICKIVGIFFFLSTTERLKMNRN